MRSTAQLRNGPKLDELDMMVLGDACQISCIRQLANKYKTSQRKVRSSMDRLRDYYLSPRNEVIAAIDKVEGESDVEKKLVVQAKRSVDIIKSWLKNVQ